MIRLCKRGVLALLILTASAGTALAYDEEQAVRDPRGSEEFVDTIIGRPLGVFALVLGVATWIPALIVTIPSHSVGSATKGLIVDPAKWTFKRPLGRFVDCDEQPDLCK